MADTPVTSNTDPGVVVNANAAVTDPLTAIGRLVVIILATAPAAILLLKKHDLIGLYNYFQSNQGAALIGAIMGLAALVWGIYKTYKRGSQVVAVAASPKVPDSVATTK